MPYLLWKQQKKEELIDSLPQVYRDIGRRHGISQEDFPELRRMQGILRECDFGKLKKLNSRLLDRVDHMLATELPALLEQHMMASRI